MKKIITSFLIFIFVSLSFSFSVFAEYDTRQLPWQLPQIFDEYKSTHKYIFICEQVNGQIREVYLYYTHIPIDIKKYGSSYTRYQYKRGDTLQYRLIDGVFIYNNTIESFIVSAYYQEDGANVWLSYDEWLPYRDRIVGGLYVIASNVDITFEGEVWDKSNGLYDLPPPDAPPPDDDNSGLVGGIVGGILNGLKSLFIPERNIFQDIVYKFSDKFPIVGQISNLIANLYNIGEVEPVFSFTYKNMELKVIDFSSFADYMPLIKNFTGAFLFLSFLVREIRILPGIIRGRQ